MGSVQDVLDEISRFYVGAPESERILLAALLSGGHVLIEGPPGTGKTTLAKAFSRLLGVEFRRAQMTADTLPADIIGVNFFNQKLSAFELRKGPVFTNVLLVDELNRAPPRTQSALLEAMQERQVTIEGETMALNEPFMVIATQVPYGSPGTYQLTDVQRDRFAFSLELGYPSVEAEMEVLERIDEIESADIHPRPSRGELLDTIRDTKKVFVSAAVRKYAVELVNHFRKLPGLVVRPGVRASVALVKGGRGLAKLDGRDYVTPDDIKELTAFVMRHRIESAPGVGAGAGAGARARLEADGAGREELISEALKTVAVPKERIGAA
jgi:MoxR-like ATPase